MPVDALDVAMDEEIVSAREALIRLARSDAGRWWTAHELRVQARDTQSSGVMGLAMRQLIREGYFESGPGLRIKLKRAHSGIQPIAVGLSRQPGR